MSEPLPKLGRSGEFLLALYTAPPRSRVFFFYVLYRLYEYGSQYFDYKNQKAFPDCEARRIFERIATGKSRSGGGGSSKRSGADGDKRDKKKRKDRR